MISIPLHLDQTRRVFRTLGPDPVTGVVGCGFERKYNDHDSHIDAVFPHYAVIVLLRGGGTFTDSSGDEHLLSPGSLFQRIPGRRHSNRVAPESGWLEFWIALGAPLYRSLQELRALPQEELLHVPTERCTPQLYGEMLEALAHAEHRELPLLMHRLLGTLFMLFGEANNEQAAGSIVGRAVKLIEADPAARKKLPEIAAELDTSYASLRRRFKNETGISLTQYRINVRLNRARELLSKRDRSIGEIAEMLGYPDQFSFSKQFRRHLGYAPQEYRTRL